MVRNRTYRPGSQLHSNLVTISHAAGRVTAKYKTGNIKQLFLSEILREEDIPQLTPDTVPALTTLAKLIMALFRTMIEQGILDDGVLDEDYNDLDMFEEELTSLGTNNT